MCNDLWNIFFSFDDIDREFERKITSYHTFIVDPIWLVHNTVNPTKPLM